MSVIWTPTVIGTDASLWLDSSVPESITISSGVIAELADLSGNARHATQSTAAMRPAVLPNDLNGLDVIQFASTSSSNKKSMTTPEFIDSPSPSVFLVAKSQSSATPSFFFSDAGPSITTWLYISANSGSFLGLVRDSANQTISASHGSPAGLDYFVGSFLLRPPNCTTRHNGLSQTGSNGSYNASTIWTGTNTPPTLGWQAGTGWYATVNIAEVIVINNSAVADANYEKIEGYLAHKWGLATSLATGHPYKDAAPLIEVTIGGVLTVSGGGPGEFVQAIDASTKKTSAIVSPGLDGSWSTDLQTGTYYFAFYADGYQTEVSGPHTVSESGVSPAIPDIVLGSSSGTMKTVGYAF